MASQDCDILAEATLTELIDNNKVILETKINHDIYMKFINLLIERQLHEKYIKLLRALCTCDGNAMVNNQLQLSQILFSKENQDIIGLVL